MAERREVLGRLVPIYVIIEGGPGTDHEAELAGSAGAILVPMMRTGGSADRLYPLLQRPNISSTRDLDTIASHDAPASVLAGATARMVRTFFARPSVLRCGLANKFRYLFGAWGHMKQSVPLSRRFRP